MSALSQSRYRWFLTSQEVPSTPLMSTLPHPWPHAANCLLPQVWFCLEHNVFNSRRVEWSHRSVIGKLNSSPNNGLWVVGGHDLKQRDNPCPKTQGSVTQESGSGARLPRFKSSLLNPLAIWPQARVFLHSTAECKLENASFVRLLRIEWNDTIKSLEWAQKVTVTQLCTTLCDSMDCSLSGFSVHEILQVRILEWVAMLYLQGIFLTQRSNPGLLHCRQILYCLSHHRSPPGSGLRGSPSNPIKCNVSAACALTWWLVLLTIHSSHGSQDA